MKKFGFPARCGARTETLDVYVWDSTAQVAPTTSQFRWWEQARGCTVPQDIEVSFTKLYKISIDNNVSYADLAMLTYAKRS